MVTGCVILHRRSQVTGDGVISPAVAARHGYREIVDDAGEQNSVAADTVAHACPLSRRTAVDTIARAACAYGAIVSKSANGRTSYRVAAYSRSLGEAASRAPSRRTWFFANA